MLRATANEPIPLRAIAADGRTDLYARATVYKSDGSVLVTLPLPHIASGMYGTTYTFSQDGYYTTIYEFFEDAAYTVPSDYNIGAEDIEANSDKTNIMRILGLVHQNAVLDNQTYNAEGNLVSARLRIYDTKANAQAAGTTGLLFQYTINAVYVAGELTSYTVVKEQ